ncbi:Bifunctional uridylyltransferase/uridylyl-removing enzyme [Bienertia sinuspersici]
MFCGKEEKTSHLFLNCKVVKRIWKSSDLGLIVPSCLTMNISSWFQNTFLYLYQAGNRKYQIWPNLISTSQPQEVLALASTEFARWHKGLFEDTKKNGGTSIQNENILLVDRAWKKLDDEILRAAYGWVMERKMVCYQKGVDRIFKRSPLQAEAHAVLAGASNAIKEWSMKNIYINSARFIQMIQNPQSASTHCCHLILDILNTLKSFSSCIVTKVNRECIRKVHNLAIQARKE